MANVIINEFGGLASGLTSNGGTRQAQAVDASDLLATQSVAIAGASAQTAAFQANTHLIRVYAEASCSVLVGANPTAIVATAGIPLGEGHVDYFQVSPGQKLAVITR